MVWMRVAWECMGIEETHQFRVKGLGWRASASGISAPKALAPPWGHGDMDGGHGDMVDMWTWMVNMDGGQDGCLTWMDRLAVS